MREVFFGVVLSVAAICIVVGVGLLSLPAAWIVAGVFIALIGYLVLYEGPDQPAAPDALEVDS